MNGLGQDLRYTLRALRKARGYALTTILTLALAIGGSTTIFTVVDSVLLRPLGFANPDRLTMVWTSAHSRVSEGYLHDWRLEVRTFEDMAGWYDSRAILTDRGEPLEVLVDRVTPNFFSVLRAPVVLGRTFTASANLSVVAPEVILSHRFWQQRFGADPTIIGQRITLDGERFTVIGVMSEGVAVRTVELSQSRAEVWVPLPLIADNRGGMGGMLNVIGRLARDATVEQAQAELAVISRRIQARHIIRQRRLVRRSGSPSGRDGEGRPPRTARAVGRRGNCASHRVRQCRQPGAQQSRNAPGGAGDPPLSGCDEWTTRAPVPDGKSRSRDRRKHIGRGAGCVGNTSHGDRASCRPRPPADRRDRRRPEDPRHHVRGDDPHSRRSGPGPAVRLNAIGTSAGTAGRSTRRIHIDARPKGRQRAPRCI